MTMMIADAEIIDVEIVTTMTTTAILGIDILVELETLREVPEDNF